MREIGYALVVWLTAASTLLAAFPVATFTCCCNVAADPSSEVREESTSDNEPSAQAARPCCKSNPSTSPDCQDASANTCSCACSCCVKPPKTAPIDESTNPAHYGLCPCSGQPEPQSPEPTVAYRTVGPDLDFSFSIVNWDAGLLTLDTPCVGNVASCGTTLLTYSPQPVDLVATLARLTC